MGYGYRYKKDSSEKTSWIIINTSIANCTWSNMSSHINTFSNRLDSATKSKLTTSYGRVFSVPKDLVNIMQFVIWVPNGDFWTDTSYYAVVSGTLVQKNSTAILGVKPVMCFSWSENVNSDNRLTEEQGGGSDNLDPDYGTDLPYHNGLVFNYSGSNQAPLFEGWNSEKVEENTTKNTKTGLYQSTFKLKSNFFWWGDPDGNSRYGIKQGDTLPLVINWEIDTLVNNPQIGGKNIDVAEKVTFEYDGKPHYPDFKGLDSNKVKVTGITEPQVAVRKYITTFVLAKEDYSRLRWTPDNWGNVTGDDRYSTKLASENDISVEWKIVAATTPLPPTKNISYVYYLDYPREITVSFEGSENCILTGTVTATEPGKYTAYAKPIAGGEWAGGGSAQQTVNWEIVVLADKPTVGALKEPISSAKTSFDYDGKTHLSPHQILCKTE